MITNESELAIIREQLGRCERALASLRYELLPNYERNFNLYARPWLDLQEEFQADIDAYLKAAPSRNGVPIHSELAQFEPLESTRS